MLPTTPSATRQSRLSLREHGVSATLAITTTSEQAPTSAPPRKRRKPGPPGIRRQDFSTYLKRREQATQSATESGRTSRLQGMDVDEAEMMEVDDTPELLARRAPSAAQDATNPTPTQPELALSKASVSSISSLTVSAQSFGASPERTGPSSERTGHPPSSPRIVQALPDENPPVPGSSQATTPQPLRTAASSSVLGTTEARTSAFSGPLRALADSIDSLPDFLRPAVNPEVEQAIEHMRDEIRGLRAELQTAQSRDSELERRVKTLEDEKTVLQETLQRERAERSYAAKSIRELDDRTGRLEKKPPPYDAIERYVRETVSSLMPSFRGQLQEVANHAVHEAVSSGSFNFVQTVALHTAVQPSNVPYRQQIDSGKPVRAMDLGERLTPHTYVRLDSAGPCWLSSSQQSAVRTGWPTA